MMFSSILFLVTAVEVGNAPAFSNGPNGVQYPGFCSSSGLNLVNDAFLEGTRLRLTEPDIYERAAAWDLSKPCVAGGFSTLFQFQIDSVGTDGADGFAFVIQNEGDNVVGFSGNALGYAGIPNSLAVEFDIHTNSWDPNGNHISVQSRGLLPNSSDSVWSLGLNTGIPNLEDGRVHTVRIDYVPGTLTVYLDDLAHPIIAAPIDLAASLNLDNGRAWVGFGAGSGEFVATQDILNWSFVEGVKDVLSVESSMPSLAYPVTGDLVAQLDTLNAGPPTFVPGQWFVTQQKNDNAGAAFRCEDQGVQPLQEPYVNADHYLFLQDEVTLDNCGSAFYRWTVDVPAQAAGVSLFGSANLDDQGVLFVNQVAVSGAMTNPGCNPDIQNGANDPCFALQDAGNDLLAPSGLPVLTSPTLDAYGSLQGNLFVPGENEIVFAVCAEAAWFKPTGVEFAAHLSFDRAYLLDVSSLTAGGQGSFTVTGATANQMQYLLYSLSGVGVTSIPQLQVDVSLVNPQLAGAQLADNQGQTIWSLAIPPAAQGLQVWLQAAETGRTTGVHTRVVQ